MSEQISHQSRLAPTGPGRSSAMPSGPYESVPVKHSEQGALTVPFTGEDGRTKEYDFTRLPLPRMHRDLAIAFAARTGPTGTLRTKSSANSAYLGIRRLLAFLESLHARPTSLGELTPRHLERYRLERLKTVKVGPVGTELALLRMVLASVTPDTELSPQLREFLQQPGHHRNGAKAVGRPGYSDREFRALVTAARSDVVGIRERIRVGEQLLQTFRNDPENLDPEDRILAAHLDAMDQTGRIPDVTWTTRLTQRVQHRFARVALARHLYLTQDDLTPLLLLGVALTGRNSETIKELPAQHRVLEGRAVAVALTKRRRGKSQSRESVHWEIGTIESRQLHTPGGFYLLLHDLMRRGRRLTGDTRVWSIWAGIAGRPADDPAGQGKHSSLGHIDPYALNLTRDLKLGRWGASHGLTDDDGNPLEINLNRLKTTVEVRRTRAVGGHLPSASRTNTMDVSFVHYLQGDPRIRDWADQVLTTAINEAEANARAFRPRILVAGGEAALNSSPETMADDLGISPELLSRVIQGELDTLASACLAIHRSPFTDADVCNVSFLTCLRCPNALITEHHLPALLSVRDLLQTARDTLPLDDWVEEHGRTWLALTQLILPKFSEAQQAKAATKKPVSLHLSFLSGPQEPR
ncbi:hypothetical protein ABZ408_11365 [Streptomyces tibetensis]|uniref:Uncharacterized protein n=1 Tax=Streptomyces tibetensis TaxID=2382123 RepID=A0ABW6MQY1_9ACTN